MSPPFRLFIPGISGPVTRNEKAVGNFNLPVKVRSVILLLSMSFLLSACSTLADKFISKKEANYGVFADYTVTILKNINISFRADEAVYTRRFFSSDSRIERQLQDSLQKSEKIINSLVNYSLNLILITNKEKSTQEQIAAYADYLAKYDVQMLQIIHMKPDEYLAIVNNIRQSTKFLEALDRAQPIINATGRYLEIQLDTSAQNTDALALEVDKRIEQHFEEVLNYRDALKREKFLIMDNMKDIYLAYEGDKKAYGKLASSSAIRKSGIISTRKTVHENLDRASEFLQKRLALLHTLEDEISPDWNNYSEAHFELDKLHRDTIAKINQARLLAFLWMRAHQKLATGITDPADWLDIDNTTSTLFGIEAGKLLSR